MAGSLNNGEKFFIKVDETQNPGASVAKYWPLLHAMKYEGFEHSKIHLFEVTKRTSVHGVGYQIIANFMGEQLKNIYPDHLIRFHYVDIGSKEASALANEIHKILIV